MATRNSISTLIGATITSTMIVGNSVIIRGKLNGERRDKVLMLIDIPTAKTYDSEGNFFEEIA